MEDEFILDFQAFKDEKNRYIVKEIAILAVRTDELGHCLIKPPFAASKLYGDKKASIDYLTDVYHGIIWEDGYMNFTDTVSMLKDMTRNAKHLYIKGSERAKFIRKLLGKTTIDFDTLNCPRTKYLSSEAASPDCFYYRHSPSSHTYFEACSLRRVYKLKKWYLEYLEKSTIASAKDEYDTVEEGHDVGPSRIQECLRSRRVASKSKFTRSSYC